MLAHSEIVAHAFHIGPHDLASAEEFARTEMTIESFANLVGVSKDWIRDEKAKVSRHVEELRARLNDPEG